ncbi:MAG: hypothetical protein HZA25_03475 [Candidatus Niyogibacteria bacterium]|nr:hypothetical protein [Candidatus Niyogibacteria bacterium]
MSALFSKIFGVHAALAYTLTETIGTAKAGTDVTTSTYFEQLFYFLLGAAAVLAVVKIVMGGLKYIYSSMSPPALEEAKADIHAAVFGLILALASYLILYTINPNLLNLDFTVTNTSSNTTSTK